MQGALFVKTFTIMVNVLVLLPLVAHSTSAGLTCGDVKMKYQEGGCCGAPEKAFAALAEPDSCPYDFSKPSCQMAGVQAPRDVSDNSVGSKPAAFFPMNDAQRRMLKQTNIHFHLGAEHKSNGQYSHMADGHRRLADAEHDHAAPIEHNATTAAHEHHDIEHVTPGWMCDASAYTTTPYAFEYCQDVEVGKTYEVHYVHSSAAEGILDDDDDPPVLTDGLGQAANGRKLLNPFVTVQAQVFVIVNDDTYNYDDMVHGWLKSLAAVDSVMYSGSTTGSSHSNEVCSPYAISWHVDRMCHPVSAKSFDKMCKGMVGLYGMHVDIWPHGSRELVDKKFVVPWGEVFKMSL